MARRTSRKRVDRIRSSGYVEVGNEFLRAAESAKRQEYWSAAGLLLVHGAIALADAVCVRRAGWKSAGENHLDAVALLGVATPGVEGRDPALLHLKKLIDEKNRVSYTGSPFRPAEVERLFQHARRFAAWVERILR